MPRLLLLATFLVTCCVALLISNACATDPQDKGSVPGYTHKDLKSYANLVKALKSSGKTVGTDFSSKKKSHRASISHKAPKSKKFGHASNKGHKHAYSKHRSYKKLARHHSTSKKHHVKKRGY